MERLFQKVELKTDRYAGYAYDMQDIWKDLQHMICRQQASEMVKGDKFRMRH